MQNQLNTAPSASAEIMNQQFDGNSVFPRGEKNEAYAKYFTGDSYLTMLSMEGVVIGNVAFEPGCRNFWHVHHVGGQILLVTGAEAGIRNGINRRASWKPVMSCIFLRE